MHREYVSHACAHTGGRSLLDPIDAPDLPDLSQAGEQKPPMSLDDGVCLQKRPSEFLVARSTLASKQQTAHTLKGECVPMPTIAIPTDLADDASRNESRSPKTSSLKASVLSRVRV